MTKRGVGVLVAACAVLALVALLVWDGETDAPLAPTTDAIAEPRPESSLSVAEPNAESGRARIAAGEEVSPTAVPEGHRRMVGTVVVIDADGGEHLREDGSLVLAIWDGQEGAIEEVAVVGGAFTAEVPEERQITVSSATLGGRPAHVEDEPLPGRGPVEVQARWPATAQLRVVDALSGRDLSGITCVAFGGIGGWRSSSHTHPGPYGPEDIRVEDGRSPLELTLPDGRGYVDWQDDLWVHAPGYAWARVEIDYHRLTRRRVELEPGGALEVLIVGQLPPPPPRNPWPMLDNRDDFPQLRLRRPQALPDGFDFEKRLDERMQSLAEATEGELERAPLPTRDEMRRGLLEWVDRLERGQIIAEVAVRREGPILLEGLAPGTFNLAIELGVSFDSPLVLGEAKPSVEAGGRSRVTVHVEPPPERHEVPLAGTFFLPEAWGNHDVSLWFEPMDLAGRTGADNRSIALSDMDADPSVPGLYRWDVGPVAPGRYQVWSHELLQTWVVDTGPSGNQAVEIEVGAPVEVRVRVEDESGRPVDDIEVLWWVERPAGVNGGNLGGARWDEEERIATFRAPAGKVQLTTHTPHYTATGQTIFDVQPGNAELVMRVRRHFGVMMFLEHEGARVSWGDVGLHDVTLSSPSGFVDEGRGQTREDGFYLWVAEPGTYRVEIPEVPGFEPVAPFEVVVPAGTIAEHTVQLRLPR